MDNFAPPFLSTLFLNDTIEWIDLTYELHEEVPSWEGECGFCLKRESDTDAPFLVHSLSMKCGIGTHIDAPAHNCQRGVFISQLPLKTLIVPCLVIQAPNYCHENAQIPIETILQFEKTYRPIWKGSLVIFATGWGRFWNTPQKYRNHLSFPTICAEVASYLVNQGIVGIGIDTLSPDRADSEYPVHRICLAAGKYIIENIANTHDLPPIGSVVFALPLKIGKGSEAPLRLIAAIPLKSEAS